MTKIRRLVLDVLKPHEPSLLDLTQTVGAEKTVDSINSTVYEIDQDVENVKMTIQGKDLDFDAIKELIEDSAGSIHSVDEVICGKEIIESTKTPQD